jgi:hypothetical protein
LVALALPAAASSTGSIDIDGDGKGDRIQFKCEKWSHKFWISINGSELSGTGEYLEGVYSIVDIDSTDAFKEIAIPEVRPSDDYATTFLLFEKGVVRNIGQLPSTYELTIDGSGRIHTQMRGETLHTWFYPATYTLDLNHNLHKIDQPLYPREQHVRSSCPSIFERPRPTHESWHMLRPGIH